MVGIEHHITFCKRDVIPAQTGVVGLSNERLQFPEDDPNGYVLMRTHYPALNAISAGALQKKLKAARSGLAEARAAFVALDGGLPGDWRQAWLEQEQQAMAARKQNPKAMDIFEVRMDRGEIIGPLLMWQNMTGL